MTNAQSPAADAGRKTYAVNVHAKAHSSNSCSFCWFVMTLYPTLTGMKEKDTKTYMAHLRAKHGLTEDIRP